MSQRDCNNCRYHKQGAHPASVVVSDDYEEPKLTCKDCLDLGLALWAPKNRSVHVIKSYGISKPQEAVKAVAQLETAMKAEGVKADAGKVGVYLLPTRPLEEIAKVLDFGAKKYAAHNWRKGMKWSRLLGALLRHTFAWARGEDKDPETGLSHLAHAGCCVLFLLQYTLEKKYAEHDDRYKEAA